MKTVHVLAGAVAVVSTAIGAAALAQGLSPADNDEILAGARECAAVTSAAGIDESKLATDSWSNATISNDGKPVGTSLTMYGKGHLLLTFDRAAKSPICIVTARLKSVQDFPKLQARVAGDYGTPVKDDGKGEQIFIAPDHRIIDLASTGSQSKPAVRVAVGPVFQETK